MGTRHLTVIVKDNKIKLSQYGQWDGYFSVQGERFMNFVKDNLQKSTKFFNERVDALEEVNQKYYDEVIKHYEEINKNNKFAMPFEVMLPQFSRDTGTRILDIINHISVYDLDNKKFPISLCLDPSWCEFVYVINLDTEEVYMLTNWEFKGKPEEVPELISKTYKMDCCYKSTIKDLPEISEIKKVLLSKRDDGFGCNF